MLLLRTQKRLLQSSSSFRRARRESGKDFNKSQFNNDQIINRPAPLTLKRQSKSKILNDCYIKLTDQARLVSKDIQRRIDERNGVAFEAFDDTSISSTRLGAKSIAYMLIFEASTRYPGSKYIPTGSFQLHPSAPSLLFLRLSRTLLF